MDSRLVEAMSPLFRDASVVELGAGCGCYAHALIKSAGIKSYQAFDVIDGIAGLTHSLVQFGDAGKDMGIGAHDWTLSLDMGSHISKQFEKQVFDNIVANV